MTVRVCGRGHWIKIYYFYYSLNKSIYFGQTYYTAIIIKAYYFEVNTFFPAKASDVIMRICLSLD